MRLAFIASICLLAGAEKSEWIKSIETDLIAQASNAMVLMDPSDGMVSHKAQWMSEYFQRTGRKWRNHYPREPIAHFYHHAEQGEIIQIATDRTQFHVCKGGEDEIDDEEIPQIEDDVFYIGRINGNTYCRSKMADAMGIINICAHGPHAFRIFNFLSDDEMEHIINLGKIKGLKRSTVSEEKTRTLNRTSQTVWIKRDESFIVDNIIRRIADVVRIPQEKLFMNASAENLQLVHYSGNEHYEKHYDFGTSRPHNRYISFLMYLNDVEDGGNTSFPEADTRCKDENGYFGVQPIKGSAVFFYNLLPDGNVGMKTLHQGEPPTNGSEKWIANLWIWDKIVLH